MPSHSSIPNEPTIPLQSLAPNEYLMYPLYFATNVSKSSAHLNSGLHLHSARFAMPYPFSKELLIVAYEIRLYLYLTITFLPRNALGIIPFTNCADRFLAFIPKYSAHFFKLSNSISSTIIVR